MKLTISLHLLISMVDREQLLCEDTIVVKGGECNEKTLTYQQLEEKIAKWKDKTGQLIKQINRLLQVEML